MVRIETICVILIATVVGSLAITTEAPIETTTEDVGTTEPPHNTTTAAPTTTASVITTPAPAPAPTSNPNQEPSQNNYTVTDGKRYCLLAKLGVRLSFSYPTVNKTNETIMFDIPAGANMTDKSTCGKNKSDDEILNVKFNTNWEMTMLFKYNSTSNEWSVNQIALTFAYSSHYFPGSSGNGSLHNAMRNSLALYSTGNGSSFQCVSDNAISDFNISDLKGVSMNFTTSNLHIEAFRSANNTNYAMSLPCAADTKVSNIVPIAVGAALAGLVVIVLVAYLIGRRKNKRGYESV